MSYKLFDRVYAAKEYSNFDGFGHVSFVKFDSSRHPLYYVKFDGIEDTYSYPAQILCLEKDYNEIKFRI